MRFSGMEILIVVIILVIVFGASRLPGIASSLGKSAKVLKKEMKDLRDDDEPREITDTHNVETRVDRDGTATRAPRDEHDEPETYSGR